MTDGKTDTQELMTIHELTPDAPQEGAIVADTPENLTTRVTALETWKQLYQDSVNSRFDNLLTPEQIKALIQASNQEVHAKITALTESNERQSATNEERTRTVNGWMDAQRQAWQALFGRDITDKDSKQLTPSIFDRMTEVEKRAGESDRRADAATLEVSEMRADHIAAVDRADTAKAEYEKYKPLFDQLQQTVNGLHQAQTEEQERRERSRQLRDAAAKALWELAKNPAKVGLIVGGGGVGVGVASILIEFGKALARLMGG